MGTQFEFYHLNKEKIMSHTLSQPEEIELVLMEMAEHDMPNEAPSKEAVHADWPCGWVSAYRTVRMKLVYGSINLGQAKRQWNTTIA